MVEVTDAGGGGSDCAAFTGNRIGATVTNSDAWGGLARLRRQDGS